jgi:hypothetical protein
MPQDSHFFNLQPPFFGVLPILAWMEEIWAVDGSYLGTGRLQTVRRETNARYYDIVDKFGQATGIPVG